MNYIVLLLDLVRPNRWSYSRFKLLSIRTFTVLCLLVAFFSSVWHKIIRMLLMWILIISLSTLFRIDRSVSCDIVPFTRVLLLDMRATKVFKRWGLRKLNFKFEIFFPVLGLKVWYWFLILESCFGWLAPLLAHCFIKQIKLLVFNPINWLFLGFTHK